MCGRYTIKNASIDTVKVSLRELTRASWEQMLEWEREALRATYNACPSQSLPTATLDADGVLHAHFMQWGLVPFWTGANRPKMAPANARSEEAFAKPMFRQAVQRRRCAVVADGFYEWKRVTEDLKIPHHIQLRSGQPFFIAGVYEEATETRPPTYALLTTRPNALMEDIHDRMPVILDEDSARAWLTPGPISADTVAQVSAPYRADAMEAWPVSRLVNSVRNNAPELVARAAAEPPPAQGDLFL
jgi:putative SOS response-associated peptidase YedK